VAKCISMLTFLHCEQFSFKAYISITTCLNVLIFSIYVGNASFKCSVRFILNIFIIVWLFLSWNNAICTTFWTGAVVRYYGNWKWCCSYSVCHKPLKFKHLVKNKLYLTIIMNVIPFEGKSKSYKHSLIIYWTALVLGVIVGYKTLILTIGNKTGVSISVYKKTIHRIFLTYDNNFFNSLQRYGFSSWRRLHIYIHVSPHCIVLIT